MAQLLEIHPTHPQARMIRVAAEVLLSQNGAVIAYPTDTAYALGCRLGDKTGLERIIALRQLPKSHQFTIACSDLSLLGSYARVDNAGYRLLKRLTPGPYTFVMKATRDVPRRLMHPKKKTIGIRMPDQAIAQALLDHLGEPLLTTTVRLPGEESPLTNAYDINERIGKQLAVVIDAGVELSDESTVIDLTEHEPRLIRQGLGDVEHLTI